MSEQSQIGRNGPTVEQTLTVQNLQNLPMFNPLSYQAYVPMDTIFPVPPFFQAQGSLQPFHNSATEYAKKRKH